MPRILTALLLVVLSAAASPLTAGAQEGAEKSTAPERPLTSDTAPIPARRFVFQNLFAVRYNPLGLEDQLRAGYQIRLYPREDVLFRDNFFFVGVYPRINPAFVKFGPVVELQPVSFFNLRVIAEYVD